VTDLPSSCRALPRSMEVRGRFTQIVRRLDAAKHQALSYAQVSKVFIVAFGPTLRVGSPRWISELSLKISALGLRR
jgi:hypothetical protein